MRKNVQCFFVVPEYPNMFGVENVSSLMHLFFIGGFLTLKTLELLSQNGLWPHLDRKCHSQHVIHKNRYGLSTVVVYLS